MGNKNSKKDDDLTTRNSSTVSAATYFKFLKYVENIEDVYDLGDELGRGAFAVVRKCVIKGTNENCAMKTL